MWGNFFGINRINTYALERRELKDLSSSLKGVRHSKSDFGPK